MPCITRAYGCRQEQWTRTRGRAFMESERTQAAHMDDGQQRTVQHGYETDGTPWHAKAWRHKLLCCTAQHSTSYHITSHPIASHCIPSHPRHSTARHSTAQHSTAQHSILPRKYHSARLALEEHAVQWSNAWPVTGRREKEAREPRS